MPQPCHLIHNFAASQRRYSADDTIVKEGDVSNFVYQIGFGSTRAQKTIEGTVVVSLFSFQALKFTSSK
jgi:hypothetical protein